MRMSGFSRPDHPLARSEGRLWVELAAHRVSEWPESAHLARCGASRRTSLSEPTAGTQPWRRGPLFMPHSGHCLAPAHTAQRGEAVLDWHGGSHSLQERSEEEAFCWGQALAGLIAPWHSA